jgi:methylphosphotriester-DNA--protein-cysteine methyltransferase
LAKIAAMSKYHFLRTFQRIVGVSPYQFLLLVRTRRAAVRLVISSETVSTIAFEAGFGGSVELQQALSRPVRHDPTGAPPPRNSSLRTASNLLELTPAYGASHYIAAIRNLVATVAAAMIDYCR